MCFCVYVFFFSVNLLINPDVGVETFVHFLFARLVSETHCFESVTAFRRFVEINLQMAYL